MDNAEQILGRKIDWSKRLCLMTGNLSSFCLAKINYLNILGKGGEIFKKFSKVLKKGASFSIYILKNSKLFMPSFSTSLYFKKSKKLFMCWLSTFLRIQIY